MGVANLVCEVLHNSEDDALHFEYLFCEVVVPQSGPWMVDCVHVGYRRGAHAVQGWEVGAIRFMENVLQVGGMTEVAAVQQQRSVVVPIAVRG